MTFFVIVSDISQNYEIKLAIVTKNSELLDKNHGGNKKLFVRCKRLS